MELQPQDCLQRVVHGVRSLTPTLVELADPDHRWLALDAILKAVSVVWLIVPDHEREEALRELTARLPDVPVSHPTPGARPSGRAELRPLSLLGGKIP